MTVEYRSGLYIKGRRKAYIGFCTKCNRETPHRRYTCSVCKTVTALTAKTDRKEKTRNRFAKIFKTKGVAGAMQVIGQRHAVNRDFKKKNFKESAEKFRKMFEGGT